MFVVTLKHLVRVLVGAVVAAGLVAVAPLSAGAAGTPCQRTFSSGTIDLPISNGLGTTVATIDVPEDGLVVSGIDVRVDIHHTFDADLTLSLGSATDLGATRGESVLFDRSGAGGHDLLGTVFDDAATTPISWGDAPFTGSFRATRPLALLTGVSGGRWHLLVDDGDASDDGVLNDWSITFRYQSCDFDGDGVEDHGDSCLSLSAHTATGCPSTSRTLTSKYKAGAFKGSLASPVAGCKAGTAVTVWKVRSGADKRVGTATAKADGTYKLTRAKKTGRYYATSARSVVTDLAECPAVQSSTFRIR